MIWIKFIKLFAFSIDFNPMNSNWIIDSKAKIRVAIRDHIFSLFSCSSQFHRISTTNPKSPSIPHNFGIRVKILDRKKRGKKRKEIKKRGKNQKKCYCSVNSNFIVLWFTVYRHCSLHHYSLQSTAVVRSPFQAHSESESSSVRSVGCVTESWNHWKDFTVLG